MTLADAVAELTPRQARDALRAWHTRELMSFESAWQSDPLACAYGRPGAFLAAISASETVGGKWPGKSAAAAAFLHISLAAVNRMVVAYDEPDGWMGPSANGRDSSRALLRSLLRARAREEDA